MNMPKDFFKILKNTRFAEENAALGPHAFLSQNAVRRKKDPNAEKDHRLPFAIDADRILYSKAYARYIDKTQVFSLVPNDHITHRALHVQFLSKIARTIGTYLHLNLDLIEAISLGHDIGHPPFGHDGEAMLDRISRQCCGSGFYHNIQSVRILEHIERGGSGLNLSVQVLDGILTHNGEEDFHKTAPSRAKGFPDLDKLIRNVAHKGTVRSEPATLEGCLVKICDTISYVARDVEDAIALRLIARSDLPQKAVDVLGDTAGKIVYALVSDVLRESMGQPCISMSEKVSEALYALKNFNRAKIYRDPRIKAQHGKIQKMMAMMFDAFCEDVEKQDERSVIYDDFLREMNESYLGMESPRIVIDYIASMTDRYFMDVFRERFLAQTLPRQFA